MSDPRRLPTYEFPKHTCGDGHKGVYYDQREADAIIAALEAERDRLLAKLEGDMSAREEQQQAEIARLREALEKLRRQHLVVEEDCWYSCPLSGNCCNDNAPQACDCGADAYNAIIVAALDATQAPP